MKAKTAAVKTPEIPDKPVNLSETMTTKSLYAGFNVWLVGTTPIIVHAWSEKAKREMLQKQVKAAKGGKEARDPQADFVSSLYDMGDGTYGFPATGVKKSILSVAHKDKGVAKSAVMSSLFIKADMVRVRPALAGAVCDMPLIRIYGSKPEMREDMVRVGVGLNKTASLAYRGQFTTWGMRISGLFNASTLNADQLTFLIREAGMACGLGEWRNEKSGVFGMFRIANVKESKQWDDFAAGAGPLPETATMETAMSLAAE